MATAKSLVKKLTANVVAMPTAPTRSHPPRKPQPVDARGHIRVYCDVPESVSQEIGVEAALNRMTKKDMLGLLVMEAIAARRAAR